MENKIKQYVNYQFRFDKRDDIEDLKQEIIANLTDRYHEYLDEGKKPDDAYIEAIKSMGDFSDSKFNEIPEVYSIKPSIPDILLMSGAILSIFGLLITLFTVVTGTIITAISILLFSGAAYYLYSYSQYVRKEYMDIKKHNMLLQKIFKYMKTSFIFWAISLSFTMVNLLMNIIRYFILLDQSSSLIDYDFDLINLEENIINVFDSFTSYIIVYIILYITILVIFLLIFISIYYRLMNQYYFLTGNTNLKGKIRESYEFLYSQKIIGFNHSKFDYLIYPLFGIIIIVVGLFLPFTWWEYVDGDGYSSQIYHSIFGQFLFESLSRSFYFISILPLLAILVNILLIISALLGRIHHSILSIGYYFWFLSIIMLYVIVYKIQTDDLLDIGLFHELYAMFMIILITVINIVMTIMRNKKQQKSWRDI